MRVIDASETGILVLGYQGESQRVMVRLPLVDERNGRNVAEEFPGGQFSLSVTFPNRPGEFIVSPSDYQVAGDWLEWVVKAAYTQFFGEGNLQINYSGFDSTGMTKSRVWRITNKKSISTGAGTVPDWSDWKTELLNAAAAVQNAVDSYDEMTAEAEDGDQTSAHIDRTGDHPVLHIEIKNNGGGGGGAVSSVNGKTGAVVLNANDVGALPDTTPIPPAVTVDSQLSGTSTNPVQNKVIKAKLDEQSETIVQLSGTVSGKYAKPSGGIPSTDMSEAVQTSLGKADTALQEHQDISGKQDKPSAAGTAGQVLGLDANLAPVWKNPFPTNYELVVDVTTEETLAAINILTDINNNPLNLSTMMMVITTPGYQNPTGAEGYLRTSYIDDNNQSHPFIIQTRIRSSNSVSLVWTERFGDYILTGASAAYDETEAWASSTNYYSRVMVNTDAIHGVSIEKYSSSSYDIPSGTRIQIYGVRA